MTKEHSPFFIFIVIIAIGLGVGAAFYVERQSTHELSTTAALAAHPDHNTWVARIKSEGPQSAYEHFASAVKENSPSSQYYKARIFGSALFDSGSGNNIDICNAAFRYGCEHGFIARAIQQGGIKSAAPLNLWCLKQGQFTKQCQHGIGHGLLASLGYSSSNLAEALRACEALEHAVYADGISGCMWGSFMEYYTRYWEGAKSNLRTLDNPYPFALCDDLPRRFGITCGFSTPQWLLGQNESASTETRYAMLGDACRTARNNDVRVGCFLGAGAQAVQEAGFNPARTQRLCLAASSENPEDSLTCLRGALEQYRSAHVPASDLCWWNTLTGEASSPCDTTSPASVDTSES